MDRRRIFKTIAAAGVGIFAAGRALAVAIPAPLIINVALAAAMRAVMVLRIAVSLVVSR